MHEASDHIGVLGYSFRTRPSKDGWVALDGMVRNAPFKPHSNYYKNLKDMFTQVRRREGSCVVVGADDAPHFPLVWTNKPVAIARYNNKYLTPREVNIVHLIGKFAVISSCIVIELCQEDVVSLDEYLSKFWIPWCFLWVSSSSVLPSCIVLYVRWQRLPYRSGGIGGTKSKPHMGKLVSPIVIMRASLSKGRRGKSNNNFLTRPMLSPRNREKKGSLVAAGGWVVPPTSGEVGAQRFLDGEAPPPKSSVEWL